MDRPRAKKKVMRAPAVSASLGSTNLKADITYLILRNHNNIEKAHSGFRSLSLHSLVDIQLAVPFGHVIQVQLKNAYQFKCA